MYVNDIIITGSDTIEAKKLEDHLTQHFEIKNLGPLQYFLGIEIAQSKKGILLTQQKYILDLLDETKHLQCKINDTPIEVNHKFTLSDDDSIVEMNSYQKLISKLLYIYIYFLFLFFYFFIFFEKRKRCPLEMGPP